MYSLLSKLSLCSSKPRRISLKILLVPWPAMWPLCDVNSEYQGAYFLDIPNVFQALNWANELPFSDN